MTEIDVSSFQKEEYIQSYSQYRWLDETRSKLIDRMFIILVALILIRIQFSSTLITNVNWLLVLHAAFILISMSFGYSIIRYRRQQRGHVTYIKACRKILLKDDDPEFKRYKKYIEGKSVYLTLGIEAAVVIISSLSPFVLTLDQAVIKTYITINWLWFIVVYPAPILLLILAIFKIFIPYSKYNYKEEIDWAND